jgi:hypothetical protein
VHKLRQFVARCARTRSDLSRTQETLDSANVRQKRRHQEDGRAADVGKKSKEQDRKETIRKHLLQKEDMANKFFNLATRQRVKHNMWHMMTGKLVLACFSEFETGQIMACHVLGDENLHLDIPNDLFESPACCDRPINLTSFCCFFLKKN